MNGKGPPEGGPVSHKDNADHSSSIVPGGFDVQS